MNLLNLHKYTKTHWSMLVYIESVVVDNRGVIDYRKINDQDMDSADQMEDDGLIIGIGTGTFPSYSLTEAGWIAAHAIRRARAENLIMEKRADYVIDKLKSDGFR